jgi:hypothetical protein
MVLMLCSCIGDHWHGGYGVWSARNTQPGLVRRSRTEAALRVSTLRESDRDGYCKLASVARRGSKGHYRACLLIVYRAS